MASQSFNLIGQEEEQELVAFDTRQSRGPTPQSRPNSRMKEMLSQLIKSQEAMAKSSENRLVENARTLETKISDLVVLSIFHYSVYRWKIAPGQPKHWIGPNSEEFSSSGACFDGQRAVPSMVDHTLVTCPGEVQRRSRFSTSEGHRSTHR